MSRWADDPEKAADALIESFLGSVALAGRVLLVNQSGAVMASLAARRIRAEAWNRRLIGTMAAAPWPPAGPFDLVLLRIPKSKDELEMSVHASLGVLRARGRLIVYGGNEEGIEQVWRRTAELAAFTRSNLGMMLALSGGGFLRELESSAGDAMIVETVAAMAKGLGLQVAAEGVETEAQLRRLRAVGCEEWQGHLYSEPLEALAFERLALGERAAKSA